MESTFRPVIWLMAGRVLGQAAAFLIPVVLVRTFDPALFGSYKRLFLLYGMLYGIAQMGFAESLYYFLPVFPDKAGKLAANAMLGLGAAGAICIGILFGARTYIATKLGDPALASLVPWIGLFLAPMLVSAVLEIAMVSRKAPGEAAVAYMSSDLVRSAFIILPALAFVSLRALLAGALAFAIARMLATFIYLGKQLKELQLDWPMMKTQLGYALPFALAVGIDTVQANYNQVFVSNRTDAATFALYSVALLQVPLVDQTATTTSSVAMVQMGEAMQKGNTGAVREIWHDTIYKLAVLFFPLVALLIVAAKEIIIVLFTARYLDAVPLFQLASFGILLFALQTDTVLRVLAETRFLFILNVLRLVVVVLIIGPMMNRWHLMGAIGATLCATLAARAAAVVRIALLQKLSPFELLPWKRLGIATLASVLTGLVAFGVEKTLPGPAIARLVAIGVVFAVTYAVVARVLGILPPLGPSGWLAWIRGAGTPVPAPAAAKE